MIIIGEDLAPDRRRRPSRTLVAVTEAACDADRRRKRLWRLASIDQMGRVLGGANQSDGALDLEAPITRLAALGTGMRAFAMAASRVKRCAFGRELHGREP